MCTPHTHMHVPRFISHCILCNVALVVASMTWNLTNLAWFRTVRFRVKDVRKQKSILYVPFEEAVRYITCRHPGRETKSPPLVFYLALSCVFGPAVILIPYWISMEVKRDLTLQLIWGCNNSQSVKMKGCQSDVRQETETEKPMRA